MPFHVGNGVGSLTHTAHRGHAAAAIRERRYAARAASRVRRPVPGGVRAGGDGPRPTRHRQRHTLQTRMLLSRPICYITAARSPRKRPLRCVRGDARLAPISISEAVRYEGGAAVLSRYDAADQACGGAAPRVRPKRGTSKLPLLRPHATSPRRVRIEASHVTTWTWMLSGSPMATVASLA